MTDINPLEPEDQSAQRTVLKVDLDQFKPYLDDTDISEAQKDQLLAALWEIVMSFVKMGYNVHPVQQAIAAKGSHKTACGQNAEKPTQRPIPALDMLHLDMDKLSDNFGGAADSAPQGASR